MQALAERFFTEEEYYRLEGETPIKHEYFNGRVYTMAGGSNSHAILCTNASSLLVQQLRGRPCRAVNSEQRVKVEATGLHTYPDVSVYCEPARFEGPRNEVLLNPVLLIEVLSQSTETYDKGLKFDHYQQIETLQDIVLVRQDRMHVEHFHRLESGDWLLHSAGREGETVALRSIECSLALSELYDGIDLPLGPFPLHLSS